MPLKPLIGAALLFLTACVQAPIESVDEMRYFARDSNAANRVEIYAERYTAAQERGAAYRAEAVKLEEELGRLRGKIQIARDKNSKATKELNALNAAGKKLTADIAAATKAKADAEARLAALKTTPAPKKAATPAKKPAAAKKPAPKED